MQNIQDLKIIGIDPARPSKMRAEPYIDLVFKLSGKAPRDWCQDFNLLFANHNYSVKIDIDAGLFIETWVRDMAEISGHLDILKKKIIECNERYIQKGKDAQAVLDDRNNSLKGTEGAQGKLNEIIANLKFD